MIRRIRSNSPIFFPDPHVIRVSYPKEYTEMMADADWQKLMRQTYKIINGTWGHTKIYSESYQVKNPNVDYTDPLAALFAADYFIEIRGYGCFKDEMDALQFRLMLGEKAVKMEMWPDNLRFQFHEFLNES